MGKATDFNDLAAVAGLGAVRTALENAKLVTPPAEWPDPILPGMIRTPEIPPDVLPSWLGEMACAVSAATQTPPALAVLLMLAVLATVLQRRFEVSPFGDDYTEPLALWILIVLQSGTRKTAVINALLGALVHWEKLERDRMRAEIARVASARAVAKKRIERLLADAAKAKDDAEREGTISSPHRPAAAAPRGPLARCLAAFAGLRAVEPADEDLLLDLIRMMPAKAHPADSLLVEIAASLLARVRSGRADGSHHLALLDALRALGITPPPDRSPGNP